MGKDQKVIWTKDGLKHENQKLAHKLKELDSKYRQIRHIITTLEGDYDQSYAALPLQRYSLLKGMIKKAVCEENMRKAESLAKKDDEKRKGGLARLLGKAKSFGKEKDEDLDEPAGSASSSSGFEPQAGRVSGLLAACKAFSGKSDGIESAAMAKKDLSQMSKQEVSEDNELKRREIEAWEERFVTALHRLEKLKADYEMSKGRFPLVRYGQMKRLVKDITQDKELK